MPRAGRVIVTVFAVLIAAAAAIAVAYKVREGDLPPIALSFERGEPPANVTVVDLEYRTVHRSGTYLEDHLKEASRAGASRTTERLIVEPMQAQLVDLTKHNGPEWWVRWEGTVVLVTLSEGPTA